MNAVMKWVDKKPSMPGYYWTENKYKRKEIVELCITANGEDLEISRFNQTHPDRWIEKDIVRWAGPILNPDEINLTLEEIETNCSGCGDSIRKGEERYCYDCFAAGL